ncbi:MAG: hypothetical protein WCS43_17190 [Verrucomicrobiota bacterium]
MRLHVFFSGAMVLALAGSAMRLLERDDALAFLQGGLTLGGGIIICGLFSLKSKWHVLIGAGVLALLGVSRGLANIPDFIKLASGDRQRGPAPVMELGVTLICLLLLLRVIAALHRERIRRMLEEQE